MVGRNERHAVDSVFDRYGGSVEGGCLRTLKAGLHQPLFSCLNPEVAGAYARRIGNLVLLSSKKNSELGNQGFAKKKATLAASEFVLTKQVGEADNWGPDEIDARQCMLADMALKVWAFKS